MLRKGRDTRPAPRRLACEMSAFPFLDFFAGSGLVTEALRGLFRVVWANDISEDKAAIYCGNHPGDHFRLGDIKGVSGRTLPSAALSWASFPCQDLSLAGNLGGIDADRSGLVWRWLRITDQMAERPPVLVVENVVGLVSASQGAHYRALHAALVKRGYKAGPMILDAARWLPQSRPRVFVVAVRRELDISGLSDTLPNWMHPAILLRASQGLTHLVWWKLPEPPERSLTLDDVIDFHAPRDDPKLAAHNVRLIPPHHLRVLRERARTGLRVAPGYKRIRRMGQALELRFDGLAGCLRTPGGGSSRQHLVFPNNHHFDTRVLAVREAARLMGASEGYKIPGTYNQGYAAMGDAVAVPVARHLAKGLLAPLARRAWRDA